MEQQSQFFPSSSERVPLHTHPDVNERIHDETVRRLEGIGEDLPKINARLAEINREWDIERALQLNAATVFLVGLGLGAFVNKRFFALSAVELVGFCCSTLWPAGVHLYPF